MKWSLIFVLLATAGRADPAEVLGVELERTGETWRVSVTVAHPDEGWDHYADAWEVLAPDGTSLGLRELLHPHVDEQPFTRSLSGVAIPDGVDEIRVRARCSVDGWTGDAVTVAVE